MNSSKKANEIITKEEHWQTFYILTIYLPLLFDFVLPLNKPLSRYQAWPSWMIPSCHSFSHCAWQCCRFVSSVWQPWCCDLSSLLILSMLTVVVSYRKKHTNLLDLNFSFSFLPSSWTLSPRRASAFAHLSLSTITFRFSSGREARFSLRNASCCLLRVRRSFLPSLPKKNMRQSPSFNMDLDNCFQMGPWAGAMN